MHTWDNLEIIKEKAMENVKVVKKVNIKDIKDNGIMIKWMVMVKCNIIRVTISILDNGRIITNMVMVK